LTAIVLNNEGETRRFGARLARILPDGAVIALNGPMGSGKTRLVQGLAQACGVDPLDVISPTFSLIHEYRGKRNVFHFDVYRIKDDGEFMALGPDEYFDGQGITVVEWAEMVTNCLPAERLEITLSPLDGAKRQAEVTGHGQAYKRILEQLPDGKPRTP
jgi:tRNA threonylcarbamoyladenosine biosynthesis protein TsaE